MLRFAILTTILAILLIPAIQVVADELPSPANLVLDGSLEGYVRNNGLPPKWEPHPPKFTILSAYLQKGGRTGERCLRLESTGEWASVATPRAVLHPGAKQLGEIWYRPMASGGGLLMAHLKYYKEDSSIIGMSPGPKLSLTELKDQSDWRPLRFEHVGSRFFEARTFNITVGLYQPGVALLDDFSLQQIEVEAGSSLVPYGDMEFPAEDFLNAFPVHKPPETVAELSRVEENPHGGKSCLRLTGKGTWALMKIIEFDIVPGKSVHGTAWKRGSRGDGHFRLFGRNAKGKVFEIHLDSTASPNWEEKRWELTPEQLGAATRLSVGIATGDDFDLYFDDVSIWME